jgi:hypothetical protein
MTRPPIRPSGRRDTSPPSGNGWRKSSYSGPTGGNCVETATLAEGGVAVRDSWSPAGPALAFTAGAWDAFIGRCRGEATG